MKKIFIVLFFFIGVTLLYSHAPSKVEIKYDAANNAINVYVKHSLKTSPIKDPTKHYVESIELKVNGKLITTNTFTKQETIDGQSTVFNNVDLKKGDKVSVKAECSIIGSKTSKIVIK